MSNSVRASLRVGAQGVADDEEAQELIFGVSRRYLECCANRGTGIAVLTSGGDAQGMNAAVRAVVRTGLYLGCKVFFVMEGYQGLVDGEIVEARWSSVSGIIQKGGTIIGSARCMDFKNKEGRKKAAKNLVDLGICNLVVIGGDGSLTGANMFRNEWSEHVRELSDSGQVKSVEGLEHLHIVGIVGSIDNDFCGTDMTIGTDSALHRILEAIDAISYTASSHQRIFIMEVMGRRCGYLALSAGLLSSASAVFIPEEAADNWEDDICETIMRERALGQRLNIIIVAEGAVAKGGMPITGDMIKDVVSKRLKQDTRVTVLGHIQRGGNPSAFDRILGSRMGVEAVLAILESTPGTEAMVISLYGGQSVRVPLMQCVQKTQAVAKALDNGEWDKAVRLRGRSFWRRLFVYKAMHSMEKTDEPAPVATIAIMHIGSPACGMNAAVHMFVRSCIQNSFKVLGVSDGIEGLAAGNFHEMSWSEVTGWVGEGGALLGTKRTLPSGNYDKIAGQIKTNGINGIFILGGFEAFQTALQFYREREKHPEFCIPILVAPATISNNVPGSDLSIGSDTALNEIVEMCDGVRQSAQGTKRRVFLCETKGEHCGYLTTLAGLAAGADATYIFEENFSIRDLQRDLYNLSSKMSSGEVLRGLLLRNEKCNENYNADFMMRYFTEEGKGIFSVRSNILGHVQQGRTASPFDRNMGMTLGLKSVEWFAEQLTEPFSNDEESVAVLGLRGHDYVYSPVVNLAATTNFERHLQKDEWWLKLRPILRILARHESTYIPGSYMYFEEPAVFTRFVSKPK